MKNRILVLILALLFLLPAGCPGQPEPDTVPSLYEAYTGVIIW